MRRKLLEVGLTALAAIGVYLGSHYATRARVLCPELCNHLCRTHSVAGRELPPCVDNFFAPAEWLDDKISAMRGVSGR